MLLQQHKILKTTDLKKAEGIIISAFGADRFDVTGNHQAFSIDSSRVELGSVSLLRSHCSLAVITDFPEASFFRQYFVMRGAGHLGFGGNRFAISRTASTVVPPNRQLRVDTGADQDHLILRIDRSAVKSHLSALLGIEISDEPVFDGSLDLKSQKMESLSRSVFGFASDLDIFGSDISETVLHELKQSLILKFILCHSHTYSSRLGIIPSLSSSPQLRLVEDFIEANWDKALDIQTLATISGVSARGLFRHFKKIRGCSPLDFVKNLRLNRASAMLHDHNESETVATIARKCGFHSPGHFSREYRQKFGETPLESRRRGRQNIALLKQPASFTGTC